ncbi:hypothetical protein [Kitasatospora sp. NPDC090091]|uniref:hypothetical protein n=1 Tax=Kitasatospora sp. NPDC090091 TaxID=3364081 RepID=UPI003807A91F
MTDHWTGELRASHLSITGGDLRLEGFKGTVDLAGAHIRDDLHLEGAQLARSEGGYSLNAPNLRIGGNLCATTDQEVSLLWDHEDVWLGADRDSAGLRYVLKGMRYEAVHASGVPFERRLDWLAESAHYARSVHQANREIASYTTGAPAPQAFDQLASAYVAAGKDDDSRSILLRKNQAIELHRRTVPRPQQVIRRVKLKNWCVAVATRAWNVTQDLFIGYGYRPSRALFSLIVLWAVGVAVFFLWPPDPYVRQAVIAQHVPELPRMNWVEHLTYPVDLLIPLVGFGERDRWHPATAGTTFLASVLVIAGWFLGATLLVSITRVVRRK